MAHFEDIKIDRHDGWKYSYTHGTNGDDYYARVRVDDNGNITEDSYSKVYKEKNNKDKSENKKSNLKDSNKEGCLKKMIKAPFKCLWWILKKILGILTLGLISSWLNGDGK